MKKTILALSAFLLACNANAAQQTITVGTVTNPAALGTNFANAQANFTELYALKHDAITLDASTESNIFGLTTQQLTLDSQSANLIFASPTGSGGVPYFRALVDADIPDNITASGYSLTSHNHTGTYLTPSGVGSALTITASGFNGNLTTTDDTIQEVADKVDDLILTAGMTWPTVAGIPYWTTGTSWGGAYTLDTDLASVSASHDTIPSAKAVDTLIKGALTPSSITIPGTSAGGQYISLLEDTDNGTGYVGIAAPSAVTNSQLFSFPAATPAVGGLVVWGTGASQTMSDGTSQTVISIETLSTQAIETTGTIQGSMVFNTYSSAQTLTAANHNASIVQMTVANEVTMWDCETANVGQWVSLWARDAEKIEVVPASGDQFVLFNGTAIGADDELDIAATAGTKVTLLCTADDTWSVYSETAACTDGGAAD